MELNASIKMETAYRKENNHTIKEPQISNILRTKMSNTTNKNSIMEPKLSL